MVAKITNLTTPIKGNYAETLPPGGSVSSQEETGLWAILKTLGFLCVLGWEAIVGRIKMK